MTGHVSTHWQPTPSGALVLLAARDHGSPGRWYDATNHRGEACARIEPAPIQWGAGWYVVNVRGSLRPATTYDPCPQSDYMTAIVRTLTHARAVAVRRVFGIPGL